MLLKLQVNSANYIPYAWYGTGDHLHVCEWSIMQCAFVGCCIGYRFTEECAVNKYWVSVYTLYVQSMSVIEVCINTCHEENYI